MKLWEGRFDKPTAANADGFNDSLPFDKRLWKEDITASVAHAEMLGKCGIVSVTEANEIIAGLNGIYKDIQNGALGIEGAEDVHSFMENELVKRIGATGKKLHTARSRNDQVATDFRLYVRTSFGSVTKGLVRLINALTELAEEGLDCVMPGYTHLRKAQPICAGHFWNAYAEMFLRDLDRIDCSVKRMNVMPLGSGALAGTSYPIDRKICAALLDFDKPCDNSLDGVSDRDYVCEYLFDGSLIMTHLSRLCEDMIIYSAGEFGYMEIPDEYSTGSSIMPQKKNPDVCELVRGKTGRLYGHLTAMLTMLKALPLAYDKDLQEDKEALFDAETQLLSCVDIMAELLKNVTLNKEKCARAAESDFCCATDVADYLAKKGMPFRDAHAVTGKIVRDCIKSGATLQSMTAEQYGGYCALFENDITEIVKAKNCADARTSFGGASSARVRENAASIKSRLNRYIK